MKSSKIIKSLIAATLVTSAMIGGAVQAQAYPNMYVSTGLHDSQVQYWEPAKWVAKLRVFKTNNNQLYLDTNMEAGHGGASGRFEAIKEIAKEFSFLLDLEGIKK